VVTRIFRIVFWIAAGIYAVVGIVVVSQAFFGSGREAEPLARVYFMFGLLFLGIAAMAAVATFLANKSRAWLIVPPLVLCAGLPLGLFSAFWIDMEKGDVHRRQLEEEMQSGRYAFGDQPMLLAVAQAIRANNPEAIRVAAKSVPDLQAGGRDGMTLLCWTVRQSWQRPELVEAARTLLSLGVDPNYSNGHRESLAMANAVHGSAALLRAMLEAGGDPNTRDEFGRPIVIMNWYLGYYPNDQRARLDLLLERGANVNSTMPESESEFAGYTLLLYRTKMGLDHPEAYADSLHLLERGADPNRVARDGMTLSKMLAEHRQHLTKAPPEFSQLWEWAQAHGIR
jgi:hypothetical protein